MQLPQEKLYTTDDIYSLPDGERAELIDGHIYNMTPQLESIRKLSVIYFIRSRVILIPTVALASHISHHLPFL